MIKVLIVDDDNLVRKGLISFMPWEKFDMKVIGEARNGEKALEFLELNEVDLLLTDLAMPVMSGMELMRQVRAQYPHLFIVVLTLHQDFEYIQEALRLGAIDYIAKVQLEKESFEEVMQRIHNRILEEQKKTSQGEAENGSDAIARERRFYDFQPDDRMQESASHDPVHSPQVDEEKLTVLKKHWMALGWVHQEAVFRYLLDELKKLQLSPHKLIQFISILANGWNHLYSSVTFQQIDLPDTFRSWYEVELWLHETRELMIKAIGKSPYSEEVQECINKAIQVMHDEISSQVHANDVAKRVNMSRSYFSQAFKDLVGMTFNEYLRHIRVEKAKQYLVQTKKTIQWIAENTGYADEKYFSRVFREKTGMLPSEYRQSAGAESNVSDM